MGNDFGKGANRLAIAAMANVTHFEKRELLALQRKFMELAQREGNPTLITRGEFRESLEVVGIVESDAEILDRLFTMVDKTGDDQIPFREFVVGLAPLITGDAADKIQFSFELYDLDGTGQLQQQEMIDVLTSQNNTASYFGDPVMSKEQIEQLGEDVFREADVSQTGTVNYRDYITAVTNHPVLQQFVAGGGTVRFGTSMK
uniref:EF-hand domain-containing protein n=1 Tax=Fibrocapsa japonica TaxID=94617 RepID=A0A7S2UWF2_9STRA|mmetsp:Transcript_16882/g.24760  ORF Transcript_16882/g.24760 Transcript_16882/m.24760 type:complete len:202 (+) Transcript_16882:84-689(+)